MFLLSSESQNVPKRGKEVQGKKRLWEKTPAQNCNTRGKNEKPRRAKMKLSRIIVNHELSGKYKMSVN